MVGRHNADSVTPFDTLLACRAQDRQLFAFSLHSCSILS
jgi:hypothetical protein